MIFPKQKNRLKLFLTGIFLFLFSISYSQNVGINTTTPDESALLELNSSELGFLPPRLTQAQRDVISAPATGLIIYNLTENCINYYDGALWLSLCGSSGSSSITIDTQPIDDSACAGENASFSTTSSGGVSYQWQVNTGSNWENIEAAGTDPTYSNYTTSTLNLSGIIEGNDGWLYRCIVTGSTPPPVVSDAATLTILPLPTQPSAISGDTEPCPSTPISILQEFNSDVLTHGSSAPTNTWYTPDFNTPIAYSSSGGCTGGHIGYSGNWNNWWGGFIRLPEMDCSGNDEVSISFDVSHSYFASQTDDWCRFYVWADGGYEHNVTSVVIDGLDVTYDSGMNGKGFQFTELRSCAHVIVTFDISSITDKSNILFYLESLCQYNNSNTFSVWFDNISVSSSGTASYDYSVTDDGYTYTWEVPADWAIDSGQGTNSVTVTSGSIDGDIIVTPSNSCGDGPSQSVSVDVCP